MGDVTLPTPGEVEGMRRLHWREEPCGEVGCVGDCHECADHWPCDARRLLALVDSLRQCLDECGEAM